MTAVSMMQFAPRVGTRFDDHAIARTADWPAVAALILQVAEVMHALHSFGCVHRDIKPSNVMSVPMWVGASPNSSLTEGDAS